MLDKQWGVWQEVWETALWPPWSEKEGRRDCPTACGESMQVLLTGAVACGEPTLEQGKEVWGGREKLLWTGYNPLTPTLPVLSGEAGLGRGAEGLELSLGKWGGELLV